MGYQDSTPLEKMETPRPSDVETKYTIVDPTLGVNHTVKVASTDKKQMNIASTNGSTN